MLSKAQLGPISFSTGNCAQLVEALNEWLEYNATQVEKTNYLVGFLNPHVFNLSMEHAIIRQFLNQSDAACLDGVGTKIAIFMSTGKLRPRVVAEHLFEAFLNTLDVPVEAILVGGQPGVVEDAARGMCKVNSHLNIVAAIDGYSGAEATGRFLKDNANTPLVLIGAGSPLSENLALSARSICTGAVIFHIGGGTLNTYAGVKKRGPKWISAIGFEWLHRIFYEPHTRHRYISGGWLFFTNLLATRHSKTGINGDPL